uniref:Uncharacterized protein n=1 Tax=Arundo donax TaxID=35708 RepID=A0A0A9AQX4_ARUDO
MATKWCETSCKGLRSMKLGANTISH